MAMIGVQVFRVRAAAVVAFDPRFRAVVVDFFFPDRQAVLDVVDDVAAGEKGVASVVRGHADPDGDIAGGERAEAVDDGRVFDVEFFFGLLQNRLSDRGCELRVAVVVERGDGLAFVVVADPTLVATVAAGCEREQFLAERHRIDGCFGELKCHFSIKV